MQIQRILENTLPSVHKSIGMEGGIGPVAGSSHHSLYRIPGIKIVSPMTPKEYLKIYKQYMSDDDVYYYPNMRIIWKFKRI